MTHPFLEKLARELGEAGVATFRYQFPYMEQRRRAPDSPSVAMATVAAGVRAAAMAAAGLPFRAGGKTVAGRRSSPAASTGLVRGGPRSGLCRLPLPPPTQHMPNAPRTP